MSDTPPASPATDTPGPSAAGEAPLLAFADCDLVGINNAMMLVLNRHNGNQQIMAPQVVEGLKTCSTFRPLAEHAAHLAATRPELKGQRETALSALENVLAGGMLLPARDILARLQQPAPSPRAATRVFIITCDRPASLQRLLESMLQAGNLSQHNALMVVDDSRDAANREANREAVVNFNLRSAKDMLYVGPQAQQALLDGLVARLPEHQSGIRFLVDAARWRDEPSYGRSRTLCLLFSVGYRAIMMDDDVLCQAIHSPLQDAGIGIGSGGLRKAAFYASQAELMRSGRPADFDPLSGHASLLGSSLGHCLHSLNNGPLAEAQLRDVNAALANVLCSDSPVLVTQCGSLGDPGTGNAHWGQYLGEDSVARLAAAPQGVAAALQDRLNWLGSSRPNIFKMPFMSQVTGLDNSRLLPPYFPAFRGEDALFGAMLVSMHPRSVALEYPWSVPHLPLEPRAFDLDAPVPAGGGIPLFARYLTERIDYHDALDPQQQLDALAQEALRTAARSDTTLVADYRAELARGHAEQLYILQNQYHGARQLGAPQWQAYLQRRIEEVQGFLSSAQSPAAMAGSPGDTAEASALAGFRELARGFAAGMNAWVATREAASALVEELVDSGTLRPL